eukprot:scaffold10440_cov161-Skeletonema_dohrnii-CCMP3373.AAC.2
MLKATVGLAPSNSYILVPLSRSPKSDENDKTVECTLHIYSKTSHQTCQRSNNSTLHTLKPSPNFTQFQSSANYAKCARSHNVASDN